MRGDVSVRLARGTTGELLACGSFRILHSELTEGGATISLACYETDSEVPRVLNLQIRAAAIEEVPRQEVELEIIAEAAARAEEHVLARHPL